MATRGFGLVRQRTARSRSRALQGSFREATIHITADLDTDLILRVVVDELHRSLGFPWTSLWLVGDRSDAPRLAFSAGRTDAAHDPTYVPQQVIECARLARPVQNEIAGMLAFPIITPLSGLVGVLHLAGRVWSVDEGSFVEAIARQAGLTLEAADLHDRASAESRKSAAILQCIADGVLVTDRTGVISQCNPAATNILGLDDDPEGRHCEDVLGLHIGERALDCSQGCALLELKKDARTQDSLEVWRAQGERRQPLLADIAEVPDTDGGAFLVHSLRDITKLKQADEAKTLFLATASHELKTPLTVIGGFAQTLLARGHEMDPTQHFEALTAIERRARELTSIVNRLLLSSRIEAGRVELLRCEVDLDAIMRERAEAVATVLDHLIENAIKYSPKGSSVEVRISGDTEESRITVRDEGIGMDADTLARCTEKFWQAESSDVRRFGGTGIGLYIVGSLVDGMGGRLETTSRLGRGTTMTVVLQARAQRAPVSDAVTGIEHGEPSVIREFMRQIGVPAGGRR